MDKKTSTTRKVKNNLKYQRDMERSFAVIYHNLKRIQDDGKSGQVQFTPRRHSEPRKTAADSVLQKEHNNGFQRERSRSETNQSYEQRINKKRVSFSDVAGQAFTSGLETTIVDQLREQEASQVESTYQTEPI